MRRRANLRAEHERVRVEYEALAVEVATADQAARAGLRMLAGAQALDELSEEEARERRGAMVVDLQR